jgi:tetratricopeptide (TPR) repeat protein
VRTEPSTAGKARQDAVAANYRETMARAAPMLVDRPQLVPYLAWLSIGETPRGVAPIDIPQASLWFRTIFPAGTVFETRRMNVQRIIPDDFVAHADAIHELAPWDPEITINWSLVRCHKGCTPEQERANYANIAAYSVTTMRKFAYTDPDPVASLRRVCAVSAPDCATLADWLVSRERFPEAAAAYEEFFRRGLDRVSVSNTVEWTVRYYQHAGRLADAKRLAGMAADVGSARGLRALAGVYDREGRFQQASALYRQILARYDDGEDLLAYFIRRADATGKASGDPEYPVLLKRYFEGELERVATASLSGAPARGLFVNSTTWWNEKAGFRRGDIIVGLDGVRVWTMAQSSVLYERSFDAPLRYTVWRGGRYLDIEAPFRRFYYGVDMSDYPPRRPVTENHS